MASDSNATNMLQAIRYNRDSLQLLDQAYIEAAEIMLEDDVASNRAIGTYGVTQPTKLEPIVLTSIDLSLSSGKQIVIEERSPKELLNTRGGLGEQVAASGISVWNPAFDVTPANLISGIITEKGVITKTISAGDAFDIKAFVQETS